MVKRSFSVRAQWDEESGVFVVAESDIIGLHIEAKTLEEFEEILMDIGPELIVANHMSKPDIERGDISDLIPAILWQRPEKNFAAA